MSDFSSQLPSSSLSVESTKRAADVVSSSRADANRKLESTAQAAVDWGVQHEFQIKDLEAELAGALSNSRAVHSLLVEALGSIEGNRQRVDRALVRHIPHIYRELSDSLESLGMLQTRLPEIREQVRAIRSAYDSGRLKAQDLVTELEWKHAPAQDKLLRIVFTRAAPVAAREVALLRLVFALLFVFLAWQLVGAVDGAYRAYRHRLVWGDKLIS